MAGSIASTVAMAALALAQAQAMRHPRFVSCHADLLERALSTRRRTSSSGRPM
jgi:hypothetical protein